MSDIDLTEAIEAHHPVKGGSSTSNIPGGYNGDWLICSCSVGTLGPWFEGAPRIPIAEYPAHLLTAAAPVIEAQVRAQIAAEIEAQLIRPSLRVDTIRALNRAAHIARGVTS